MAWCAMAGAYSAWNTVRKEAAAHVAEIERQHVVLNEMAERLSRASVYFRGVSFSQEVGRKSVNIEMRNAGLAIAVNFRYITGTRPADHVLDVQEENEAWGQFLTKSPIDVWSNPQRLGSGDSLSYGSEIQVEQLNFLVLDPAHQIYLFSLLTYRGSPSNEEHCIRVHSPDSAFITYAPCWAHNE